MILTSDRLSSYLRMLLTVYFLGCVGFFAVRTAHWTQVNDPAQLHYLCFLMDHGMAPYRDLLEINMPGIYLVNWSVMHTLGGGSAAWRVFDFGLMAIAAWAMIAIARPYDWLAGVFGATLFILFHGRDGAGQEGQRDFIIAVLLLCAYSFLFVFFPQPPQVAHVRFRAVRRNRVDHQADASAFRSASLALGRDPLETDGRADPEAFALRPARA